MTEELTPTSSQATSALDAIKPAMAVTGKVTRVTLYGAMVDIGLEQPALLHISQFGRTDFHNVADIVKEGDQLSAFILRVDKETQRVALTTAKPPAVAWDSIRVGDTFQGTVVRIEKFGVFVEIGAERPGMVHISELTDGYVQSPSDVVSVGDVVEVRVIRNAKKRRQLDLSMRTSSEELQEALEPDDEVPTAMALALRRAMQGANNRRNRR